MATRKDVALIAGVSVATVSNVFSGNVVVSKDAESKVLSAARKLKYVPNHTARSLSLGRSNHIGIAINESTNPFHMEIVRYIEEYALSKGFLVTVFDLNGRVPDKAEFIEKRNLDALVNFTTVKFYDEFFDILKSQNTIMVNFGLDKGMSFGHYDINAILSLMEKLRDLGHKNVGYICTLDRALLMVDDRTRTFIQNRAKFGFTENDDLFECCKDSAFLSAEFGYQAALRLMKRHPEITALFAMNDIAAIGAMRALKDMGLNCPDDVSVIGCDDIELSRLYIPSLSTINFDKEKYGTHMAEKIIECIMNKESGIGYDFTLPSFAVFRESIGICKKKL